MLVPEEKSLIISTLGDCSKFYHKLINKKKKRISMETAAKGINRLLWKRKYSKYLLLFRCSKENAQKLGCYNENLQHNINSKTSDVGCIGQ